MAQTIERRQTRQGGGMSDDYDDLDDGLTYCVYCYDAVPEWKGSCCGENHFLTGKEIKDYETN